MAVHGFSGGGEFAALGMAFRGHDLRAQFLKRPQRQRVLAVKITGDDEGAVLFEAFEALLEDALPERPPVIEILVAEKEHIEFSAQLPVGVEARGIAFEKFKRLARAVLEAAAGVVQLALPHISANQQGARRRPVRPLAQGLEKIGECFRLVARAAGHVQDGDFPRGGLERETPAARGLADGALQHAAQAALVFGESGSFSLVAHEGSRFHSGNGAPGK